MRDLLFKAKRLDNGQWVQGRNILTLIPDQSEELEVYIAQSGAGYSTDIDDTGNLSLIKGKIYKVDPATVCQFTGQYNYKGVPIWENDIVESGGEKYTVEIEGDVPGGYWAETGFVFNRVSWNGYISFTDTVDIETCEICVDVLGNIFDNPELLEGGAI